MRAGHPSLPVRHYSCSRVGRSLLTSSNSVDDLKLRNDIMLINFLIHYVIESDKDLARAERDDDQENSAAAGDSKLCRLR